MTNGTTMAHCTMCGAEGMEPGFAEDRGEGSQGYVHWVQGALERGIFGGAKRMGRSRLAIEAFRCTACGHLELFATNP